MAIPFLTSIDLNQNQLLNARLQNLGTDPVSPVEGQIWENTTSHRLKFYDSSSVRIIAALSDSLSAFAVPSGDLSIGSHKLTNVSDPTVATDAATKGYVDALSAGLDVHASVRYATAAALSPANTLASGVLTATSNLVLTVDGTAVAVGDRILVKNEAAGQKNGIYVVTQTGSAGAPYILTRASDCSTAVNYTEGAFVFVERGTVNAGVSWLTNTTGPYTIDTTVVTWVTFTAAISYSAGSGLTLTGTVFSANVTGVSTEISGGNIRVKSSATSGQALLSQGAGAEANYGALNIAGGASFVTGNLPVGNGGTGAATAAAARTNLSATGKFAQAIGDGSTTSIVVTHNLGTQDVTVQVYTALTPFAQVNVEVQITSVNTVTLVFAVAPTSGQYRVVVVG